jgi:hypothetical protein
MTQYCAIFHFAGGLQEVNLLSDTSVASVVIVLALCLRTKKNIATGPNNVS